MSGQYAHTNRLMGLINRGWSMPEQTRTVVGHLNDAGYETAHFGSQHERYDPATNRYQVEGVPFHEEDGVENDVDRTGTQCTAWIPLTGSTCRATYQIPHSFGR